MTCPFCAIIEDKANPYVVYRDDRVTVFPTNAPLRDGHLLIVPNTHLEDAFAMPEAEYQYLFTVARRLEPVLKRAYSAPRVSLLMAGMEIPHVHLHLCPIFAHGDMDSSKVRKATTEAMGRVAQTVRTAMEPQTA